jgi:coiled-coil domain-containing protein 63/114
VNFSLFNFVAEQSNEVERLEDALAQLKAEEARLGQESGDGGSTSHQVVKDLEVKISAADSAAQKYEARFAEASKTVGSVSCLCVPVRSGVRNLSSYFLNARGAD